MAQGITEAVVDDIKSRIDLGDLISSYGVAVKHAGSSLVACCPFHNEKTPSFNINVAKGFYHCFGCGESGDAIKFVMKQDGLSFVEAVKKLAAQCGIEIAERADPEAARRRRLYALMAEVAQFYHRCLGKMREAAPAREYLDKRRLDAKTQEDYLIGYAPSGMSGMKTWAEKYGYTLDEMEAAGLVIAPKNKGDSGYHRFGGRLMFSVKDKQGRVVAFSGRQLVENKRSGKYVNSPETAIFKKSNVLFGFDKAAGAIARSAHREAICCEGQIDTIRLHTCGFPTAVASLGTAFTEEHARMIKRVADAAVLMYDDDAAGHKASVKTGRILLAMGMPVRVASLPGGDDPDSFLCAHPAADLQAIIDASESIVAFQCRSERAKEANPGSIDAVRRVSKEVLLTIAACPSAVVRAALVDEAAKLLGLPSAALAEELDTLRREAPPPKPAQEPRQDEDWYEPAVAPENDDAGDRGPRPLALPPPEKEIAFMAFLTGNEYDSDLAASIGSLLPRQVFAHDLTRRFVEVWCDEVAKGEDLIGPFADSLPQEEREWLDKAISKQGNAEASGLGKEGVFAEMARFLWSAYIERELGAMPAVGDPETDARRIALSLTARAIKLSDWQNARQMILETMKGEQTKWT